MFSSSAKHHGCIFCSKTHILFSCRSCLYIRYNEAGHIPNTPSTILDIVLNCTIERCRGSQTSTLQTQMSSVPMEDTHLVIIELKDQSTVFFPPLSCCFTAEIPYFLMRSPHLTHHLALYHVDIPYLMVTPEMSGFSAWFAPNPASCNRLYPCWVNASQTSSQGVDGGQNRACAATFYFEKKGGTTGESQLKAT